MTSISSNTLAIIYILIWYFHSVSGEPDLYLVVKELRLTFQYLIRICVFGLKRGRRFSELFVSVLYNQRGALQLWQVSLWSGLVSSPLI